MTTHFKVSGNPRTACDMKSEDVELTVMDIQEVDCQGCLRVLVEAVSIPLVKMWPVMVSSLVEGTNTIVGIYTTEDRADEVAEVLCAKGWDAFPDKAFTVDSEPDLWEAAVVEAHEDDEDDDEATADIPPIADDDFYC